jgi:hypothetical protein
MFASEQRFARPGCSNAVAAGRPRLRPHAGTKESIMKLAVLMLAAILPLTGCILVPVDGYDHGDRGHERDHDGGRDHRREHCDHDGRCDERRHD